MAHTLGNLRDFLRGVAVPFTEPAANLLAVPLASGVLERLADGLGGILTPAELRDTRSLVIGDVASLGLADLAAMQSLATFLARARGQWFTEILRENRLTSHFQPIVSAGAPDSVFAYECLLRGVNPDGTLVAPGRLYQAARDADLLSLLDRAARLTAIREAAAHGLDAADTRLFINFNPTSIYDPAYCLRSTVSAVADTALRPDRIVFEVVESDHIEDIGHLVRIENFYRDAGFQIALDDLGSGYGSLNLLSRMKPDFAKLDMQLVRGVDHDAYKASIVAKLLEMAHELGVATVAEGIETEEEWRWFRDHGADYAQGYFIAHPGSLPPRPRKYHQAEELQMAGSHR
jgi:EAL domain-containing protein (putative c-di-GMP-specific phosphodiesterase class I)